MPEKGRANLAAIYIISLVLVWPFAYLIYYSIMPKFGVDKSVFVKAIYYGVLCGPSVIELHEGHRGRAIVIGLHALFAGYHIETVIFYMFLSVASLYIYFRVKGN